MDEIPLADAIQVLREQLTTAMVAGEESRLRFAVKELTLDLEIAVTKTGEGHGGIKFWMVDFGAKKERSNAATHRITLTLNPVDDRGQPLKLGNS
jgi:Trypsin-co-occurring domain 2